MASTLHHAGSPQYPAPPSYPRRSTDASMNALQYSQQSLLDSFEGAQSVGSTPTATPRGPPQHLPWGNAAPYAPMNGNQFHTGLARGFGDVDNNLSQQHYSPGQKPQIYTAVYSGVSVYEMEVNTIAVMRRRSDSWLNATQILKVAGIEKGKRTKVLEKEILAGEHEKVQGGYGKYQGTWINYGRGVEFCRQYGVEEMLRPLLEYDMGQDGMTLAGQGGQDTPTKEQAHAAQRKKNMLSGATDNRLNASSSNGTFFKNISSGAANAVNALSRARFESPERRPGSSSRRPAFGRQSSQHLSQQVNGSQESAFPGSSQQSMQSLHSDHSFGASNQLDPSLTNHHNGPYFMKFNNSGDITEPPRKRARPSSSHDQFIHDTNGTYDASMRDTTPTEANESFVYHQYGLPLSGVDNVLVGLQPLPQPIINTPSMEKQQLLTSLFLDPMQTDFSHHEALQRLSGEDLDIPIDSLAHTALHWAATLARTSLMRALIQKGASIFRLNGGGETALIRAALTTNNLDHNSFPELLELLGPTIEMRDGRGRTVLHHIAVSSAVKGRTLACRYYLESLLEFVVRQGSASNSQQDGINGFDHNGIAMPKPIGLARFMAEIVNASDMSGDTALNIAARIGNKGIIQQLLEVGANPTIPNRGGLKPVDFGVGGEPEAGEASSSSQMLKPEKGGINKVGESSRDLMTSISTLLSDTESSFRAELQSKQSLIDQTHAKLRESTTMLNEERTRLEALQQTADERKDLRSKIVCLQLANDEMKAQFLVETNCNIDPALRVTIGEADAGLEIDASALPTSIDPSIPLSHQLTTPQLAYITSLPPPEILEARTTAYEKNNLQLQGQLKGLRARSTVLEAQLKRVIALCTNAEEGHVDDMVGGLVEAVDSEAGEDVEMTRVREFLRRVEET